MNKSTLLIVDDEPVILSSMSSILSADYTVRIANSGERALSISNSAPYPDLILLDVKMPNMDGYKVLEALKQNPKTQYIPVIFVTAMETDIDEEKGLKMGAVDYMIKPVKPAILLARVKNHLILKQANDFLNNKSQFLETEVSRRMSENLLIQEVSIRALAHLAETRDPETGEHILRTQAYVNRLANILQNYSKFKTIITSQYVRLITQSAPLHDIGKVGIPDKILLKPGKFTKEEFEIMKTHSILGSLAIEKAEADTEQMVEFLILAKEICHWHHERWDGSGYPDGLSGESIPLAARIMTLADVFDALISKRIYKQAFSFEQAKNIIIEERGKQFDPELCDIFISHFDQFVEVASKYQS